MRCTKFISTGCPIRISADQFVCANPRSFSQLITSFFASESLGIRHAPLTIFLLNLSNELILCVLLFIIFSYISILSPYLYSIYLTILFPKVLKTFTLYLTLCFGQYVNERCSPLLLPRKGRVTLYSHSSSLGRLGGAFCGEYRSRTDDLLRARQAL